MSKAVTIRSEFGFWRLIIAVLGSTVSLISLVQRAFSIGLAPILSDFVSFYRKIFYPIIDLIFFYIPWSIPVWYKDLVIISFIFAALDMRSRHLYAESAIFFPEPPSLWTRVRAIFPNRKTIASGRPRVYDIRPVPGWKRMIALALSIIGFSAWVLILSATLIGIILPLQALYSLVRKSLKYWKFERKARARISRGIDVERLRVYLTTLCAMLAATIAFFAVNSQL